METSEEEIAVCQENDIDDDAFTTEEETDTEGSTQDEDPTNSGSGQQCVDTEYSHLNIHEKFRTEDIVNIDYPTKELHRKYANIAFYVKDENTGKVYGITNRHVTIHTDKVNIKRSRENKYIPFGVTIKSLDSTCLDAGLIEIDPVNVHQLSNKEDIDHHVSIYPGSFESIYGKTIIKYKPNKHDVEVCAFDTPTFGTIVSEMEHDKYFSESDDDKHDNYETNGQFLVKCEHDVFAVKGESGTAVAVKEEENDINLIGMICGGCEKVTVCIFLPTVMNYFKEKAGMSLELYEHECYGASCDVKPESCSTLVATKTAYTKTLPLNSILFGVKIHFIITPEKIAPFSFDLVERALSLMCLTYNSINVDNFKPLIEREHSLSLQVSERGGLNDNAIFENDIPDYVAVAKGMLAVDHLYMGKAKPAETSLKQAISCVPKSDGLGLRLICKLSSYITWYCLVKNDDKSLELLNELLDIGIDIFECDFKNLVGFPLEALGYMYYDFSRYYMTMLDNSRRRCNEERNRATEKDFKIGAVDKAKKAVEIFQEDHDKENTSKTLRRLVLASCQHAYALLGYGHDFNTSEHVSEMEVTEAEIIMRGIKGNISEIPLVQKVDYYISLCDIHFRRGDTPQALLLAHECLKMSRVEGYFIGFHRAKCRAKILSKSS